MLGWNTCLRLKFAALCKRNSGFVLQLATRGRVIRYAGSHPCGNHQEAQLQLWEDLFSNPSEWWDNRLDKRSPQHPDFRHKKTREPLWLNNQYKPLWVCPRLATLNARPHDEQGAVQMASLVGSSRPNGEFHSLCEQGLQDKALDLLSCMDQKGTVPSVHVYASLLRVCAKRRALDQAKQVHSHLAKHGLESTQFLGESVVRTLVKCGGLEDALQVFQKLSNRTAFSWTALISGFTTAGNCNRALRMYDCMLEEGLEPNKYTFVSLLKACSAIFDLKKGKRIHGEALKYGYHDDLYVGTCLIDMYAKCGSVVDAQNVFDALPQRDVVAWTAIISAYIQQGEASKALQLYGQMKKENVSPDAWIFVSALQACRMLAERAGMDGVDRIGTKTRSLQTGRAIHAEACSRGFKSNLLIANTLMSMYGKCGSVVDASNVFHGLLQRDVASWNVMILAYVQEGQPDKAFQLYEKMLQEGNSPDARTFVGALQACCKLNENLSSRGSPNKVTPLEWGHIIHSEAWERGCNSDAFVGSILVLMYSTYGSIVDARSVFDSWSRKDVVLWNAMLGAYAQKGQARKAFDLYDHMQEEGLSPNVRTLVSILQACGMLTENEEDTVVLDGRAAKAEALARGKEIHAAVFRKGYESDVFVGNTRIGM